MKKQFLKYQELNEALKLSQYREYHDIRPKDLEQKLDSVFLGNNRIYIPLEYKVIDSDIIRNEDIKYILSNSGYEITNYLEGYCEKDGRTFKIGKILNKINRPDLLKTFNEDPNRAVQNKNFLICISKHPYDIAGMSTDRGWTSCMNLENGSNGRYISKEIKEGTVIAYLINENDKNINHPYGRINIKPYISENGDLGWGLADYCYGSLLNEKKIKNEISEKFKLTLNLWLDENLNSGKKGHYRLNKNVYNESENEIYIGDKNSSEYKIYKFNIKLELLNDGVYRGNIIAPKDLKEFRGFKEELGLDIKEVQGNLEFFRCKDLTSVSNLPKKIGWSLYFSECRNLTSVSNLPEKIGSNLCFDNCDKLKSILDMSVTHIGKLLHFYRCPSLESLPDLKNVNYKNININFMNLKSIEIFNSNIKGDVNIYNIKNLTTINKLPIEVGNLRICNCGGLTSVSKMPEIINHNLDIHRCESLKEINEMSKFIKDAINIFQCPFFEGMDEEQIRETYNISR